MQYTEWQLILMGTLFGVACCSPLIYTFLLRRKAKPLDNLKPVSSRPSQYVTYEEFWRDIYAGVDTQEVASRAKYLLGTCPECGRRTPCWKEH